MSTLRPTPAVMMPLKKDGQPHRFYEHQIHAMVRLLTKRSAGKMVVVHERNYATPEEASSPSRAWDLDPGEATFSQFRSELQIVGTDGRIADDGHGSTICWLPIEIKAETHYRIRGQMVEIGPFGASPGPDVEIMFVDVSTSASSDPDSESPPSG